MPNGPDIVTPILTPGFDRAERGHAARLFWQAFGSKLGPVLAPEDKALSFLSAVLHPDFAISARDREGRLLGLAGVKTAQGGLVGGGWRDLARVYGWPGALWRGGALSLLERQVRPDTLLMDGIFVAEDARGRGVGSALLGAVKARAAQDGKSLGPARRDRQQCPRPRALRTTRFRRRRCHPYRPAAPPLRIPQQHRNALRRPGPPRSLPQRSELTRL